MSGALTQQQLGELSEKHQVYRNQAESISQQINVVGITIKDVETALTTITALKDESAGTETLVPIGFGSFVKANLVNTDTIVVGVGAGISVEKNIEEAMSFLEKRKDELIKYQEQLNNTISKLAQELQHIEKLVQKHQQSQQPMHAE
ncbi:MAG: prefoldin subunit alpha [Candidatus Methanoperedens sp.]|nr:prefoldin subunit alpha [Candidatus Methanoperedens sp.]